MILVRYAVVPVVLLLGLGVSACSDGGSKPPEGSAGQGTGGVGPSGGAATNAGSAGVATSGAAGSGSVAGAPGGGAAQGGGSGSGGASSGGAGSSAGGGGSSAAGSSGSGPAGGAGWVDPGTEGDGDFEVGPSYTDSPDLTVRSGAPEGFDTSFDWGSEKSEIFSGDDFDPPLSFDRRITVFIPSQYRDGSEAPFMVSSDGFYGGLKNVVRNLAGNPSPDRRVPPLVIIGIQNGPNDRPSERSLEYDTVSDRYWRFVTQEVLPAVESHAAIKARFPNFKLTRDPNGRGGYGCSSGGPAVFGLAWFGDFNRVFSFSGSYTALQTSEEHPDGAWEYPDMIAAAPLRPQLRVFLHVGERDNGYDRPATDTRNWVSANRRMAAALKAKGNHYRFVFAKGGGHCGDPPGPRNQIMPESLIWLWRGWSGYPAP
jgi:enterochelin esterase family protein